MKQNSPLQWERYKNSEGKEVIAEFEKFYTDVTYDLDSAISLAKRFNPEWFANAEQFIVDDLYNLLIDILRDVEVISEMEADATPWDFYVALMKKIINGIRYSGLPVDIDSFTAEDYYPFLSLSMPISLVLSRVAPELFIPNFFDTHYSSLKKFADDYELRLPPTPKPSQHFARGTYYFHLCLALYQFREDRNLSPAELCALLFHHQKQAAHTDHPTPLN